MAAQTKYISHTLHNVHKFIIHLQGQNQRLVEIPDYIPGTVEGQQSSTLNT